jgi:hypothetical protein
MTVAMLEKITIFETINQPEIFSLSPEEINRILAEDADRPKRPPDPCLLEDSSEGFSDEPITEYQDSWDSSGLYYW